MSIYGKGLRGKATRLHAELVRGRGRCENDLGYGPGHSDRLECAHIITRSRPATRVDLANAFCLCSACHRYFTAWPVEFGRFVVDKIGADAYDDLRAKAMAGPVNSDGVRVPSGSDAPFWQDRIYDMMNGTI